jgi:hypothetical protein
MMAVISRQSFKVTMTLMGLSLSAYDPYGMSHIHFGSTPKAASLRGRWRGPRPWLRPLGLGVPYQRRQFYGLVPPDSLRLPRP